MKEIQKETQTLHFSIYKKLHLIIFSPVLLADKQVEGILCPQEVVVIKNLHSAHPVRIKITSNLSKNNINNMLEKTVNKINLSTKANMVLASKYLRYLRSVDSKQAVFSNVSTLPLTVTESVQSIFYCRCTLCGKTLTAF